MGLTSDQQMAFDAVMQGKNVFITGGGGCGKTYLLGKIMEELSRRGKTVLVTASTGKAANLIGGATCHRTFSIPLTFAWKAAVHEPKEDNPIYAADVILIDEVSMLRIDAFDFIIRRVDSVNKLRATDEYRSNPKNKHLDPIQIIVVGDFCQLPPVIKSPNDGGLSEKDLMSEYYHFNVGQGFAFQAPGWERCNFETIELNEVVRQSDRGFIDALNRIRFGDRTALSYFMDHSRVKRFAEDEEGVVHLCGTNKTAERINRAALSKLPGEMKTYDALIEGQVSDQDKQAPDHISLKIGANVIMLRNTEKYRKLT